MYCIYIFTCVSSSSSFWLQGLLLGFFARCQIEHFEDDATGIAELVVHGLVANVGSGSVSLLSLSSLMKGVPRPCSLMD